MGKQKKEKHTATYHCNICNSEMTEAVFYTCPNCGNSADEQVCSNCNSNMTAVKLFNCLNCGNTIDEPTLIEKMKIKKKFEGLK